MEQARFQCQECEKDYKVKNDLNRHIKVIHREGKLKCELCNKEFEFTKKSYLLRHVRSVHKGIKFDCNKCEKKFSDKYQMKRHQNLVH